MNLLENYNTASQKYGIELVKQLSELGLPPQYLLSACRFVKENNIPLLSMINQFKEWTKFVIKYNKYDVNRLSYDDFLRIISQEKSKHIIPNLIWQDEIASLGKLNNAKDVQKIPVKNQWCIKSQNWFDRYTDKGYVFFVIYLPNEPLPFTFAVVAVCGGNVEYYDIQDYEQFEDLRDGNKNNSDHEVYQRKLPNEIVSYLYDIAATQTEEIENKITNENKEYKSNKNMKKQVIRLTEGDLHRIIKESVNNVLTELNWKTYQSAAQKAYNRAFDDDVYHNLGKFNSEMDRSERFGNAAEDAFSKEYPDNTSAIYHTKDSMGYQSPICNYYDDNDRGYEFQIDSPELSEFPKHKISYDKMLPSERDVRQVANGTAKYIKGKGWTKPRQIPKGFNK